MKSNIILYVLFSAFAEILLVMFGAVMALSIVNGSLIERVWVILGVLILGLVLRYFAEKFK